MNKDSHTQYVKDLVELQDKRGKEMSAYTLEYLKKMLKMSKGNTSAFLMLVKKAKPILSNVLHQRAKESIRDSAVLGRRLLKEKTNAKPV